MYGKVKNGFTLIEMVAVFAIITIMTAVTLIGFSASKVSKEVDGQVRVFASAIREAQNYSLTGKSITATAGVKPCEYRIASTVGGSFSIQQYRTDAVGNCVADNPTSSYSLANSVTFSSAKTFIFKVPRGEPWYNGSELSGSVKVDFFLEKGGKRAHVCVYPLGRVEETRAGDTGSEPQCP